MIPVCSWKFLGLLMGWFALGFIGRCLLKNFFVKSGHFHWGEMEDLAGAMLTVLGHAGLLFSVVAIFLLASLRPDEKIPFGLKL